MNMTRAVIYVRISKDREGAGLGVDRQRADCVALAERMGWLVVGTYTDNDISAYSGKLRPGYTSMMKSLEQGHADAIIAWHTDRLHRSPRELESFIDLCERQGLSVQTVRAGVIDLSNASGRMVARMLGRRHGTRSNTPSNGRSARRCRRRWTASIAADADLSGTSRTGSRCALRRPLSYSQRRSGYSPGLVSLRSQGSGTSGTC